MKASSAADADACSDAAALMHETAEGVSLLSKV